MNALKSKLSLITMALVLTGVSSQSMAVENAKVDFTARLVTATCDISANTAKVDLGTHAIGSLTTGDISTPIAEKGFNLVLNNCTKVFPGSAGEEGQAVETPVTIIATGNTLAGHNDLFSSSTATQVGVKLTSNYEGMLNTELKPNESVAVLNAKEGETEFVVPVTAGLMTTVKGDTLKAQDINVPVTFSVAYD
ncbi:fimbrial protein [Proteus penneri]|uniref:Fimbrial protein n=1 Tax=Proteus penneri TaxID=102862 RepID=A0A0G4Q159_9GAMM|nr:hypothetical protein [Proteus penneri]CRL59540.1 Fimbrial protein [Proteus penneri]